MVGQSQPIPLFLAWELLEEPDFRLIVFAPDYEDIIQWQPQITP